MTVLLVPVLKALLGLAAAAITAATPYVALAVQRALKVQKDSAGAAVIDMAVQRGGGIAYKLLAQEAGQVANPVLHNAAVAQGVNHVLASIPDTLEAFGITPEQVGRMVSGELGKLLAVDPSTVVTQPATAPAAPAQPTPAAA